MRTLTCNYGKWLSTRLIKALTSAILLMGFGCTEKSGLAPVSSRYSENSTETRDGEGLAFIFGTDYEPRNLINQVGANSLPHMKKFVEKLGFETTVVQGAKLSDELRNFLSRESPRMGPDTTLFVSLLSHGAQGGEIIEHGGTLFSASHFVDLIHDELLNHPVKRIAVVVDACYSGSWTEFFSPLAGPVVPTKFVKRIDDDFGKRTVNLRIPEDQGRKLFSVTQQLFVISSTSHDFVGELSRLETAPDGSQQEGDWHSIFSQALFEITLSNSDSLTWNDLLRKTEERAYTLSYTRKFKKTGTNTFRSREEDVQPVSAVAVPTSILRENFMDLGR